MRPLLTSSVLALALVCSSRIDAAGRATPSTLPPAWCAPETEALPGDVCHVDFNAEGRRTLVIFLHGVVPHASTWQWTQQRALLREARAFHFAAIMPQALPVGPHGAAGYAWPGSLADQRAKESELVDQWSAAQRLLELRAGRPFDEVFVVGFSSGAYFATSLALRDRLKADGYVLLAGGAPTVAKSEGHHRAPIFIGVSATDYATAPSARSLGRWLAARDWPHRVNEQPVGHMVSDLHMVRALSYLRATVDESRARGEPVRTRANR